MLKKNINTPHSDTVNPLMGSLWKGKKNGKKCPQISLFQSMIRSLVNFG